MVFETGEYFGVLKDKVCLLGGMIIIVVYEFEKVGVC